MIPLKTRTPTIYLERGTLRVAGSGVVWESDGVQSDIPVARIASLLLGPGSSVTHAAIAACAKEGTLIQWVGEAGTKAYAASDPLVGDGERLKMQVLVAASPSRRSKSCTFMFNRRFNMRVASGLEEAALRGMEGGKVKEVYQKLAAEYKVIWPGRKTGTGSWGATDPLNQAISMANGHLLQVATVAVVAAGFSPAIGFLHSGFNRAFACDIADLHKFEVSVPLAFKMYAHGMKEPHKEVRHAVRDEVVRLGLIDRMIQNSIEVVDAGLGR